MKYCISHCTLSRFRYIILTHFCIHSFYYSQMSKRSYAPEPNGIKNKSETMKTILCWKKGNIYWSAKFWVEKQKRNKNWDRKTWKCLAAEISQRCSVNSVYVSRIIGCIVFFLLFYKMHEGTIHIYARSWKIALLSFPFKPGFY